MHLLDASWTIKKMSNVVLFVTRLGTNQFQARPIPCANVLTPPSYFELVLDNRNTGLKLLYNPYYSGLVFLEFFR